MSTLVQQAILYVESIRDVDFSFVNMRSITIASELKSTNGMKNTIFIQT